MSTAGFAAIHDPSRDAYDDGEISGKQYLAHTSGALAITAVGMTGVGSGARLAAGATTAGTRIGYGAATGAATGGGYDAATQGLSIATGVQEDYNVMQTVQATAMGTAFGVAAAGGGHLLHSRQNRKAAQTEPVVLRESQAGPEALPAPAAGGVPNKSTANGREYLGQHYDEAKQLFRKDPGFFPDPDATTFRTVGGEELRAARAAFVDSGQKGHHVHPLSHGGDAVPQGPGLVFTGESTIPAAKLDGLDLSFYSQYGKDGAKRLNIYQETPDSLFQFGKNPRHAEATIFWNKVTRSNK